MTATSRQARAARTPPASAFSATALRSAGVVSGVAAMAVGATAAGGWWWIAGAVGAAAVVGSLSDRQSGHAVVLATLALTAGIVAAGRAWALPLVVAGVIASFESLAAADRATVVRPTVAAVADTGRAAAIGLALSAIVLVVGAVTAGVPALGPVVAALAATVALRVVAR